MNKKVYHTILCFSLILQIFTISIEAASHDHHDHVSHADCVVCHFISDSCFTLDYILTTIIIIERSDISFNVYTASIIEDFIVLNYPAHAPPLV